jgi:hypothetical protein
VIDLQLGQAPACISWRQLRFLDIRISELHICRTISLRISETDSQLKEENDEDFTGYLKAIPTGRSDFSLRDNNYHALPPVST